MSLGGDPAWEPGPLSLHAARWQEDNDDAPTTVLLQHPSAPYVEWLNADDERKLRACAHRYLVKANGIARLDLPARWLAALAADAGPSREFGWLAIDRGTSAGDPIPLASFWFQRQLPGGRERTLVLIAGERCDDIILGSEFGIRIVAHVEPDGSRGDRVRITGLSASLPFGDYWASDAEGSWGGDDPARAFLATMTDVRRSVAQTLGLFEDSVFFRSFRIGRGNKDIRKVEIRGRGLGRVEDWRPMLPPPYDFVAAGTITGDLRSADIQFMRKSPMSANAGPGDARLFPHDPASLGGPRPSRPDTTLDGFRQWRKIANKRNAELRIPDMLDVVPTAFVRGDDPGEEVKKVALPGYGPPIRTNDFAAVSAYRNLGELFDRFSEAGISPSAYFRTAALPIKAAYRSGVRPGPGKSGRTINACVTPEGWRRETIIRTNPAERPVLGVHFALADLSRRARRQSADGRYLPAEPLGIAADPRWAWHEIGHVLLMAAIGELEFRFAHSCGDALAAIAGDPGSALARDERRRGLTFPWVFTPRRHDRNVLHGWGWAGALNRMTASIPDVRRLRRKGYWTEQILSTSLFRLYRAIGGDTVREADGEPDDTSREAASRYTIYLIVKALGLLGDARLAPATRPEQFVASLVDADVGTLSFRPALGEQIDAYAYERIGGCAHKVARWAFEAQGMFGPASDHPVNAPGQPQPVDIYIPDRRSTIETNGFSTIDHGPGSYVPTSLDWGRLDLAQGGPTAGGEDGERATPPGWHADAAGIDVGPNGAYVTVGNRGRETAQGVSVILWTHPWPAGSNPPRWDPTKWTAIAGVELQDVPAGERARIGPFAMPAASGRQIILAQATCAADPSNIDPLQGSPTVPLSGAGLPCGAGPTLLPQLVAGDNNLGLVVHAG